MKELFDIIKANELLHQYEKNRELAKTKLLKELISYQKFFGSKSILGCDLLLVNHYQKKIIETVISDLNYSLIKPYINSKSNLLRFE